MAWLLQVSILLVVVAEAHAQGSAASDREVLEALYHATGGPEWSDRTNWLSAAPVGEWFGVSTDGNGRVTSLALPGNGLSGGIPPALGRLASLERLDLGRRRDPEGRQWVYNQLSGAIPPELASLSNLQSLYLGDNSLYGKIPGELMQLSELTEFDISRTDVCVPTGDDFQAWLATISDFRSSGINCDGSLRVSFSASSYVVREGGSAEVTVRLIDQTNGPARSATIALTVTPGGGATGHDYAGVPERITITAPASTGTFLLTAVEDHHYDHAETIMLGFRRPLPPGVTVGSPDTFTVMIIDPGAVLTTDREVLEALYEATGGPEWSDRTNWLSAAPLGEWFGISTDGNGRVTSVALPGNGLSGGIPPALGRLASLERLNLGRRRGPEGRQWVYNRLSGAIPPELASLSILQSLDLGFNQLSGAIPPELASLSNLQSLDLAGNQLSGAIPPELASLSNLQLLYLWGNQLSGAIPPELASLSNLQSLDLGFNQLSGAIPPELASLSNLQRLYLEVNQLSGAIPPELASLSNLQLLYLWRNQLSGAIPPELASLSNLQRLDLSGNQLSGAIPSELASLSILQRLDLSGNQLSGAILPELASLSNLQSLYLAGNQLSGAIPPELASLSILQRLDLSGNQLSGAILPELASLSNLQSLYLAGNQLSGAIPPELASLSNLQSLYLAGNQLSGAIPSELQGLTNLESLDLEFNQDLSGTIPAGLQQLPLSSLNLMATALCEPLDAEFQQWLATIDFLPSGASCGRPPEAMSSIDVAVFYTPAARRMAGGATEIETLIDLMVAETNQAYEDSGVNQRIVLAANEEVQYEDTSGFSALRRLADRADGYMDEVHEIRDRVGADLVHLIIEVTNVGGIADLPGAFSLSAAGEGADTFAHELGHNMGLSHDRHVARNTQFPYSHGYVNQQAFLDDAPGSARWRTIMAYGTQCSDAGFGCDQILRFSNPNQTHLGDPLGAPGDERTSDVTGPADAARSLNITRHSVAAFRPRSQDTISQSSPGGKRTARPRAAAGVRSGGLFTALSPLKHGAAASDPKTLRRREVDVNIGMLAQVPAAEPTALPLNLFEDVMLTGIIVKRTPTYSGGYALSGPLFGVAGGSVTLVVNGDVVAGTVRIPGATYRIRPAGAGRHAIAEIDPAQSSWRCGTETGPPNEKNR